MLNTETNLRKRLQINNSAIFTMSATNAGTSNVNIAPATPTKVTIISSGVNGLITNFAITFPDKTTRQYSMQILSYNVTTGSTTISSGSVSPNFNITPGNTIEGSVTGTLFLNSSIYYNNFPLPLTASEAYVSPLDNNTLTVQHSGTISTATEVYELTIVNNTNPNSAPTYSCVFIFDRSGVNTNTGTITILREYNNLYNGAKIVIRGDSSNNKFWIVTDTYQAFGATGPSSIAVSYITLAKLSGGPAGITLSGSKTATGNYGGTVLPVIRNDGTNYVKLSSPTVQTINSDLALATGKKFFATNSSGAQKELAGVGEYGTYEQTEIGSESNPLCLNHNAVSSDGTVVGNNISVNYKDEAGDEYDDTLVYTSDLAPLTVAPTADWVSGSRFVYLTAEPATKYNGYWYNILES
jgi:hypothetical protein